MLIPYTITASPDRQNHHLSTPHSPELIVLFLIILVAAVIGPHQIDVRRGIVPLIYWQAYGVMAAIAGLTLWRLHAKESAASQQHEAD